MGTKKVSVAEGKKSFTQLLKEAENEQTAILIHRRGHFVGALVSANEYQRFERLQGYFEALRISQRLAHLEVDAAELARESRQELEERDEGIGR